MCLREAEGRLYRRELRVLNVCSGSDSSPGNHAAEDRA